jgi:glycosyltransferase involved in cell wall biosynthesis
MAPLVSIVINNFNYARYLPAAIESALGQDHTELEVIVVDDGSTDESRDVMARYAGRIRPILKENGGMASALNTGFSASSGAIVVFLDADDYLHPSAASKVTRACTDSCAKVQYRLSIVDQDGNHAGTDPPLSFQMPNGDIVPELLRTGRYTTPVTSGNAYPRRVLDQVMPIPEAEFKIGGDGFLNAVCPFYGDVISIDEELGSYRHHGTNRWAFSGGVTAVGLRFRFEHDLHRQRFLRQAAERHGHHVLHDLLLNEVGHVMCRLSLLRFDRSEYPIEGDSPIKLARAGLAAIRRGPSIPRLERAFCRVYLVVVGVLPGPLARPVIRRMYDSAPSPRWVRTLARVARGWSQALGRLRLRRSSR